MPYFPPNVLALFVSDNTEQSNAYTIHSKSWGEHRKWNWCMVLPVLKVGNTQIRSDEAKM